MIIFELNHLIDKIFFTNNLTFYETLTFKISSDDIVFDCGENMGLFSAAVANRCKKVYSFEPMSLIRKNLQRTQQLYDNIIVIPKDFWNNNKICSLELKDNPGASGLSQHDINHTNYTLYKELCSLITLDSFVETTGIIPTFIKVDIEGSEIAFLEGAIETLLRYKPRVSIVSHYHSNSEKLK
jgi:FkbM family methyltransferase